MKIKQFEYKPLAHYSYALVSEGEMVVIDPERNPKQYYDLAKEHNAEIVAVIETHPHADFVSAHLQMHQEIGATLYCSEDTGADYPHKSFDEGDEIRVGAVTLTARNTPGHSPDSITVVATDGSKTALFTGDTLFIGDVGRPDLRESAGNKKAKRQELAEMMYHTMQSKFKGLPDDAIVYPTHGAGSLCGKGMSDESSSTLGEQRDENWAFNEDDKDAFIEKLLDDQPFIPAYFGYNVDVNKEGAKPLGIALKDIPFEKESSASGFIIDCRDEATYKKGHLPGSFNIQCTSETAKFETWLGAVLEPNEHFTLVVAKEEGKDGMLERVAKIGYEKFLTKIITPKEEALISHETLDLSDFKEHPDQYTIVDIRNTSEINEGKIFEQALAHPLPDLRESASFIPTDKPIVVHCAGGYRSAVGSSILKTLLDDVYVYDLSDDIKKFK